MVVYGEIVGVEEGGVGDGLGIGWDGVGGCLCRLRRLVEDMVCSSCGCADTFSYSSE